MPGTVVEVRWPVGPVEIDESMSQWDWTIGPSKYIVDSADPNDHYRPWLERNVGRQGWDWNWRLGKIAADNGADTRGYDTLTIKLRKKHAALASFLAIKWG